MNLAHIIHTSILETWDWGKKTDQVGLGKWEAMHISNQNGKKTHVPKLEFGQGIRVSTPSLSTSSNQDVCSGPPPRESNYSNNTMWDISSVMTPKKADTILEAGAVHST